MVRARATGRFSVLVAIALLSTPRTARADALPTNEERAIVLFERAADSFRRGAFRESLQLLDEADRLKPSAILHYNKARAHEGLGEKDAALVEYRKYLEMDPNARDIGAVQSRISILEGEINQAAQREADERRRRAFVSPPETKPPPPVVVPWLVVAAGGVSLGLGTYFGIVSKTAEQRANDAPSQVDARDSRSEAEDSARAANISFVIGGALVVGGLAWGLLELSSRSAAKPR